jgi:hypothetical protein
MSKPIDVTDAMDAEADLMDALREWQNAGAPVIDVVDAINRLIEARVEIALRDSRSASAPREG